MELKSRIHVSIGMLMITSVIVEARLFAALKFQLKLFNVSTCSLQDAPNQNLSLAQCASQCHENISCIGFVIGPNLAPKCQLVVASKFENLGCQQKDSIYMYFEIECPQYCRRLNDNGEADETFYNSECQCSEAVVTQATTTAPAVVTQSTTTTPSVDAISNTTTSPVDNATYQAGISKLFVSTVSQFTNSMNVNNECYNRANRGTTVMIKDKNKQGIVSRLIREDGILGARFWIGVSKSSTTQTMVHVDDAPLGSPQPWVSNPTSECLRAFIKFEDSEHWACETDQNAQYRYICDLGTST